MAYETTARALHHPDLKPMPRLLLALLCDFQNAETGQCNPSQRTLANGLGVSISTVNKHLKALEMKGVIVRIRRTSEKHGGCLSTQYIIRL